MGTSGSHAKVAGGNFTPKFRGTTEEARVAMHESSSWWRTLFGRLGPGRRQGTAPAVERPSSAACTRLQARLGELGFDAPELRVVLRHEDLELFGFDVSPLDAFARWRALRAVATSVGFHPVLLRVDGAVAAWNELLGSSPVAASLAEAADLDGAVWLADGSADVPMPGIPVKPRKPIPIVEEPSIPQEAKQCVLLLLPTADVAEAPAWLGWGGWNGSPSPAEHTAVFRYWHRCHGAEPIAFGSDCVELLLPSPISGADLARRTVREWAGYSDGVLDDPDGCVADALRRRVWYFWWD